jgi:hypothetical protein
VLDYNTDFKTANLISTSKVSSATVSVMNVAPAAALNAPSSVFAGFSFTLSLTGASDPSPADASAGFTYAFDGGSGYDDFGPSNTAALLKSLSLALG